MKEKAKEKALVPMTQGHDEVWVRFGRRKALRRILLGATATLGTPWAAIRAFADGTNRFGCPIQLPAGEIPEPGCDVLLRPAPPIGIKNGVIPAKADPNEAAKGATSNAFWIVAGAITGIAAVAAGPTAPIVAVIGIIATAVAGLAGLFISLFWPDSTAPGLSADTVWNLIKDRVEAMIDQKLKDAFKSYYTSFLDSEIEGLGNAVKTYRRRKTNVGAYDASAYKESAVAIYNWGDTHLPLFKGAGKSDVPNSRIDGWVVLPQYVQAVNNIIMVQLDACLPRLKAPPPQDGSSACEDIDRVFVSGRLADLTVLLDDAIAYVDGDDGTLQKAYRAIDEAYKNKRNAANAIESLAFSFPFSTSSALATGLWQGTREHNQNRNNYVLMVEDYLRMWKALRDYLKQISIVNWIKDVDKAPVGNGNVIPYAPPKLDRELWYGPFGRTNLYDIGVSAAAIFNPASIPDIGPPPPTPAEAVGSISTSVIDVAQDGYGFRWHASEIALARTRQLYELPKNVGVTSLRYTCVEYERMSLGNIFPSIRGDAVFSIDFNLSSFAEDGTSTPYVQVGSLYDFKDEPAGWDQWPAYAIAIRPRVETIKAPDGHVLANVWTASNANALRDFYLKDDHPRTATIPSTMMFSFRYQDPTLLPKSPSIAMLYVTSPTALTVRQTAELGCDMYALMGRSLSDDGVAMLEREIAWKVASEGLDEKRTAFWASIQRAEYDVAVPASSN